MSGKGTKTNWYNSPLVVGGMVCLCLISAAVGGGLTCHFSVPTSPRAYQMQYADYVSIMLTAVSVILTAVAVVFAGFGIIGWVTIERKLNDKTNEFLNDGFRPNGILNKIMIEKIDIYLDENAPEVLEDKAKAMFSGMDPVDVSSDSYTEGEGGDEE